MPRHPEADRERTVQDRTKTRTWGVVGRRGLHSEFFRVIAKHKACRGKVSKEDYSVS